MSITVITVADYKSAYPDTGLNNIRDARIQSAINLALQYLDIKTGCQITKRWDLTSTEVGYLTDEQKAYVKSAFLVETQYIISNNMDFSQGSDQVSFGSLSTTSTRPVREEVCSSALMYLQQAGLYDYLQFSSPSYFGNKGGNSISDTDLSNYITYTVGDQRYVLSTQTDSANHNKYLYFDSNGVATFVDLSIPALTNYYTKAETDTKLSNYALLTDLSDYLTLTQANTLYYPLSSGNDLKTLVDSINDSYVTLDTTQDIIGVKNFLSVPKINGVDIATVGTSGGAWGTITGNIQDQTDLQDQFSTKQAKVTLSDTAPTNPQDNDIWVSQSSAVVGQIDTAMSDTSTNPVENKVIKAYVDSQSGGGGGTAINLTGSSGTLTADQLSTLQASNNNYIILDSEYIYKLAYKSSVAWSYFCDNYSIIITISNRNWVLNETEYVIKTGDTMSGDLTIQKSTPELYLDNTESGTSKLSGITFQQDGVEKRNILYDTTNDKLYINSQDSSGNNQQLVVPKVAGTIATLDDIGGMVSTTYDNLVTLRTNSKLVAGTWYRITDYVATTTQTNTQATTNQYDIIVLATSTNTLSEDARAIQHSGDTYFSNSNLNAWKLKYSLTNDTTRFAWADSTNGKGVVYWLQDEFDNQVWYDFKCIQVKNTNKSDRYYYLFDNSGVDASLNTSTTITCYSNHFGNYINSKKYNIGCNICYGGNIFYNNTIGNYFYYNTIENYFYENTIGNSFHSNTIGNDFRTNTIGKYFYDNTIGKYFYNNTIGTYFYSNTIGKYFYDNTIGNKFNSNNTTGISTQPQYCTFPNNVDSLITTSTTTWTNSRTYYLGSDGTLKSLS